MTFESSLAELEAIVQDLEEGQLGLAQSLERYEQGVKHLKHCYGLLQQAEQKIELLTGVQENGTPVTEPLEETGTPVAEGTRRRRVRKNSPATPPPLDIAQSEGSPGTADSDIDD